MKRLHSTGAPCYDWSMANEESSPLTKYVLLIITVIAICTAAMIIDNHTPLFVWRISLSEKTEIRILYYDKENTLMKTLFENAKYLKDSFK